MDETTPVNDTPFNERNGGPNPGAKIIPFSEPFELFHDWFNQAAVKETGDHTAVALATAAANRVPSVRMVLLKEADERGFVFYTNMESRKGAELLENPHAALCFHWPGLQRSVRVEGATEMVSEKEADAYFASRPREARIGAWASTQSRALSFRLELEKRAAQFALKFNVGKVPRPPHWTGCRVIPQRIEFWRNRPFRLHDRTVYDRAKDGWLTSKLFP